MTKVETETSAKHVIRTYETSATLRSLRDAAEAVLEGACQYMPVVWAVESLGEAIADGEDAAEAQAELEAAWLAYCRGSGKRVHNADTGLDESEDTGLPYPA